jgi:anthranilate synthase component 2
MRLLLLDNYDSFTYNLYDYLVQSGCAVVVKRNDEIQARDVDALRPDGIVFSPGPRTPKEAGCLMDVIKEYHERLPMLGVCLGHQAIGEFFGATLQKAIRPVHGKTAQVFHVLENDESDNESQSGQNLLYNIPQPFEAMRYHSLVLTELPEMLIPLAQTTDGELMAMRHRTLPLYGVQFHPESILTPHGLPLIKNWVSIAKSSVL